MNCQSNSTKPIKKISLKAIVESYLTNHGVGGERYLRFYAAQRSLANAITKAAMAELPSGKRFAHQRRIPRRVLINATSRLLNVNYKNVRTFSELHRLISQEIGSIHGIGPLTIYDTAHRLGAYLNLRPEFVYLHAGTKKGAAMLNLGRGKAYLPMAAFPREFHKLRPEQVEDCLCIYKQELRRCAHSKNFDI